MNTHSHDFVTVDMRGLKAALVARAQAQRVSVSVLVRGAVARDLGLPDVAERQFTAASAGATSGAAFVKLSIRLTQAEAAQFAAGARTAGLSRAAYLVGLIEDVPVLSAGGSRSDHLAALIESSAELSTLSRNIHHLISLLRKGSFRAALEYREMLETLAEDIRGHLALASSLLADLRPRRGSVRESKRPAAWHS